MTFRFSPLSKTLSAEEDLHGVTPAKILNQVCWANSKTRLPKHDYKVDSNDYFGF